MASLRIAIADDHEVLRMGLRQLVSQLADQVAIVEAGSCREALEVFGKQEAFDLALVDTSMRCADDRPAVQVLCERFPQVPVVAVSVSDRPADVWTTIDQGAKGYISLESSLDLVLSALRLVLNGGMYVPRKALEERPAGLLRRESAASASDALAALTPRQREVLQLIGQGKSNKQIAEELGVADGTVKIHVAKILKILKVKNRMQAVLAVEGALQEPAASG